jgi:hypothetical protein
MQFDWPVFDAGNLDRRRAGPLLFLSSPALSTGKWAKHPKQHRGRTGQEDDEKENFAVCSAH